MTANMFEEYIRNQLEYAKNNETIMEAMRIFGMSWEQYEAELRWLLTPKIPVYTTATTTDNQGVDNASNVSYNNDGQS